MRQLLGTATLELTRWCFSSSPSKFLQILKILGFSLLGMLAAALCAPKILELGVKSMQVWMGMGGTSSPGPRDFPNHRFMEPMRLEKPPISWSPIYDQPPPFQTEQSTEYQVLSKALPGLHFPCSLLPRKDRGDMCLGQVNLALSPCFLVFGVRFCRKSSGIVALCCKPSVVCGCILVGPTLSVCFNTRISHSLPKPVRVHCTLR